MQKGRHRSQAAVQRTSKAMDTSSHSTRSGRSGRNHTVEDQDDRTVLLINEIETLKAKVEKLEREKAEWGKQRPLASAPYGSYCTSGANPQLLQKSSQKVHNALDCFVLGSMRDEASTETVNSLKADISKTLFSEFERADFGVEAGVQFTHPGQLPELSFKEYKAFEAFVDDSEDDVSKTALVPYKEKFDRFSRCMCKKMEEAFRKEMKFDDTSRAPLENLAMDVWMLHKLTFSFDRANVRLLRVGPNEPFINEFMESVGQEKDRGTGKPPATLVKYLILPGLWINGSIIKCRVYLRADRQEQHRIAPAEEVGALDGTATRNMKGVEGAVPDAEPAHAQQTETTRSRVTRASHSPSSESTVATPGGFRAQPASLPVSESSKGTSGWSSQWSKGGRPQGTTLAARQPQTSQPEHLSTASGRACHDIIPGPDSLLTSSYRAPGSHLLHGQSNTSLPVAEATGWLAEPNPVRQSYEEVGALNGTATNMEGVEEAVPDTEPPHAHSADTDD